MKQLADLLQCSESTAAICAAQEPDDFDPKPWPIRHERDYRGRWDYLYPDERKSER